MFVISPISTIPVPLASIRKLSLLLEDVITLSVMDTASFANAPVAVIFVVAVIAPVVAKVEPSYVNQLSASNSVVVAPTVTSSFAVALFNAVIVPDADALIVIVPSEFVAVVTFVPP